jgi:ABC-type glycerol-3-phosphate transport system substrate-binding protein
MSEGQATKGTGMNKLVIIAGAAALGLAACSNDTPAENEVEKQAEAIDEAYEADAKVEAAFAEGAPNEEQLKDKADALRKEGEQIKDDLKDQADEMGKDTRRMNREAN